MTCTSLLLSEPFAIGDMVELARAGEAAGYDRVWIAETDGPDAFVAAAAVAAATERVELGTAIVSVYTRTSVALALAASSVADLSGRPFRLGIGAGGRAIVEQWHGLPFERPRTRLAESVHALRDALGGGRTATEGELVRTSGFRLRRSGDAAVHLYVGTLGPKALADATRTADGIVLTFVSVARARELVAEIRAAADGRPIEVVARLIVARDAGEAFAAARASFAPYLASPPYARHFRAMGFDREVDAFEAGFRRGDRRATAAAVSDALLGALVACGADEARARAAALADAGVDDVMLSPLPELGVDHHRALLEELAP